MDQRRTPIWHVAVAVALGAWIVAVTTLSQLAVYVFDLVAALLSGTFGSDTVQAGAGMLAATLVAAPAAVVAGLPLAAGVRATARAWMWAGAASALLAAARLAPAPFHELYLLGLTSAAPLASILQLWWLTKRDKSPQGLAPQLQDRRHGRVPAVATGLLVLAPWVWLGALGGLLETALALAAAATVGFLAALTVAPILRSRPPSDGRGDGWRTFGVGVVTAVALVPLAGAVGETGVALAELAVLPPLGFALAVLRGGAPVRGGAVLRGPAAPLLALAAAGPLAFVDPEETSAILGITFEVGFWTLVAGVSAFLVAVLAAVGLALARRGARPGPGLRLGRGRGLSRRAAAGLLAALALATVAVHLVLGQPGLHGDRLFVVLTHQADLTGLDTITDRAERLRQTYHRLVEHADRTQADLRRDLRRYRIGFRPYYLLNGIEVDAGPALRPWLAGRSDVDIVLTNPVLRPLPAQQSAAAGRPDRPAGPLWNIQQVRADQVWEAADARGAGIVVGSSDSGVDGRHPALESAFRGGDDSWYDPWNDTARPTDHNGHGTHTLGTVLGRDGIGVAPDASWMGCVNLDRNLGSPAHYLDCMQFMLAPFPRHGDPLRDGRPERAAHVLTNSWGCPQIEGCERRYVLSPAIAALTAAGIFVVAAAGNTGDAGCRSITDEPATDPEAMTVGAVDRSDAVPTFSSRGPLTGADKPDVVAPGVNVLSAAAGGGYRTESGTSMATPHVAGVVALMWSANRRLIGDIPRTADILRSTARVAGLTISGGDCGDPRHVRGAGLVDALAAVAAAKAIGP